MATKVKERISEKGLLKRLQEEDLRPFYIIYGQERFFISKATEIIEKRILLQGGVREFSIFRYYGPEVNAEDIIDLAQTAPFLGGKRLVLIMNAEGIRQREAERLCEYFKNPCPFSCMLLLCGAKFPDGDGFRSLRLTDKGACVEFPRPKKASIVFWIHEIAGQRGIRLHPSLVDQIIDTAGTDLEVINNQIEKISLFFEEKHDNREEGIAPLLNRTKEEPFYLLADSLFLNGFKEEALKYLTRILEQGDHPLVVLSRLLGEIRKIWRIRETLLKGGPVEPVFRELRIPDFKQKGYVIIARHYTEDRLRHDVQRIHRTDRALKSSRLDPKIHLERLVLDLCVRVDKGKVV